MSGGGSHKPIVFVFGAEKGDADGRKKNLSAINTQVAYRAHERRREKKSRQRALAKQDGKVDQPASSVDAPVSTTAQTTNTPEAINFNHFVPAQLQQRQRNEIKHEQATHCPSQSLPPSRFRLTKAEAAQQVFSINVNTKSKPSAGRRESDLSSDTSSDQDAIASEIWSASPSSDRHSSPATDLNSLSPLSVSLGGYFDKALDPFFRLPTAASDREKWLVHFYFREMGHIGFGTHSNALFCPDRDWVSTYVSSKSLCFQWILIHAEEHLGRIGVMPDQTKTLERKAKAYGSLNLMLRSRVVDRDEGISSIMYAAILDRSRTPLHLMALDRLINDTGGFEAFLDGPLGIAHPEHVATVYAFGPCPISNLSDLENIKARVLDTLRMLSKAAKQEQEEKRRIRNRRPWDTLSRHVVDSNGILMPASNDEEFRYYMKSQQDCFNSDCLAPLLNSALNINTDYADQARHFAALVQALLILLEFGNLYIARATFLKRLKYVAEMSSARDMQTRLPCLSHAGLLLINSYVRQEVQNHCDRTKILAKGIRISKAVVDCLKIFPLMQQSTRSLVVSWLRDWLCYNDHFEDIELVQVQEKDLSTISSEVTTAWFASIGRGP